MLLARGSRWTTVKTVVIDVIFLKVANIQGTVPSSELGRQSHSFLEEIAMITASLGQQSTCLPTIINQAAPSGSNLDHLGSDDDQAVVASVRQELN